VDGAGGERDDAVDDGVCSVAWGVVSYLTLEVRSNGLREVHGSFAAVIGDEAGSQHHDDTARVGSRVALPFR
jgi:hypothetical protein